METRPILTLLALFMGAAAMADTYMYTWTDDEGVVHYSDRPHPAARRIVIEALNTTRPPPPQRTADAATTGASGAAEELSLIHISEPTRPSP